MKQTNKPELNFSQIKDYTIIVQAAAKEATPLTRLEWDLAEKKWDAEQIPQRWSYWLDFVIGEYRKRFADAESYYDELAKLKGRNQELRDGAFEEQIDASEELPASEVTID